MNRREFLKRSAVIGAGTLVVPTIVKASIWGPDAPSNRTGNLHSYDHFSYISSFHDE